MSKNRFRLGKLFGIPIRVDSSWLLIFIWVTWSLAANYYPRLHPAWPTALYWAIGALTSLLFFTSVLLHELGHSLVARSQGTQVKDITLFIFGGVAEISDEPSAPGKELIMAVVGPLVSLALSGVFALLHLLTRNVNQPLAALGFLLGSINLSLGVFNLIPGFPLDGGRVLRAVLWKLRRDLTWATRWATWVGQTVAYLFVLLGIVRALSGDWANGLWIAVIGFFLENAARSAYAQLTLRKMLEGHVVGEIMREGCALLPPQLTLDLWVDQYLLGSGQRCLAVGTPERMIGLLTIHNVRAVPKNKWPETHVGDVATPLEQLHMVMPQTPLWDALQQMTEEGVNQLPVAVEGRLVGMLSRDQLLTFLRNRSALGL